MKESDNQSKLKKIIGLSGQINSMATESLKNSNLNESSLDEMWINMLNLITNFKDLQYSFGYFQNLRDLNTRIDFPYNDNFSSFDSNNLKTETKTFEEINEQDQKRINFEYLTENESNMKNNWDLFYDKIPKNIEQDDGPFGLKIATKKRRKGNGDDTVCAKCNTTNTPEWRSGPGTSYSFFFLD